MCYYLGPEIRRILKAWKAGEFRQETKSVARLTAYCWLVKGRGHFCFYCCWGMAGARCIVRARSVDYLLMNTLRTILGATLYRRFNLRVMMGIFEHPPEKVK